MLAEIHGKISRSGSNLTDRLEDDLTGNFFGNLRYLPFEKAMKKVLEHAVFPTEIWQRKPLTNEGYWADRIQFWPHYTKLGERTEPDVVIEFEDIVILIEVKLYSGLSSDDDICYKEEQKEIVEFSKNQLDREARLLKKIAKGKRKVLLFLAKDDSCRAVYNNVEVRNLVSNAEFGYMSWESVYDVMCEILSEGLNTYEQVIVQDVIELLSRKDFVTFRNFLVEETVKRNSVWLFDDAGFSFTNMKEVHGGEYYEFR